LGLGLAFAVKLITGDQRNERLERVHVLAITGLLLTQMAFAIFSSGIGLYVNLSLFFAMFCILEASLPSMVAARAPVANRGAAMGVYSSLQFFGVFCGGSIGGWVHMNFGVGSVLGFCMLLSGLWLCVTMYARVLIRKQRIAA
jgi:predicted MFS family arabinose efflux permease